MKPKNKRDPERNPIGEDGKLCYPPTKYRYMQEEEDRIREMEEERNRERHVVPGIVNLEDLLTGEYMRKKRRQMDIKKKEKNMKRKLSREEIDYIPDDTK